MRLLVRRGGANTRAVNLDGRIPASCSPDASIVKKAQSTLTTLRFYCSLTQFGESLVFVTSDDGFNVSQGVFLHTNEAAFPLWTGEIDRVGLDYTFKLVIVRPDGSIRLWETGDNLTADAECLILEGNFRK